MQILPQDNLTRFSTYQSPSSVLGEALRYRLFKFSTPHSTQLFIRGSDTISVAPQVIGEHERSLSHFICSLAAVGMSDYLIDIGANIGLMACQTGNNFKRVVCFEPNPICASILKVNCQLSSLGSSVQINEFGLGDVDGTVTLWIPKHNWGGAFVYSKSNTYSESLLARKDDFDKISPENYLIVEVQLRNTFEVLRETFSNLSGQGLVKGIIKIDVEGMENTILEGIAKALPPDLQACIIFENLDASLDTDKIRSYFQQRPLSLYRLTQDHSDQKKRNAFTKYMNLLIKGRRVRLVDLAQSHYVKGDIVLFT